MPRSRIPTVTKRLEGICDEAGLPRFDEKKYEILEDVLLFLWHDPQFCLGAPLGRASVYGLTAEDLAGAWERKFGAAEAA